MAEQNKIYLPPTGNLTIRVDWEQELNSVPRVNETLASVAWTLPAGLTNLGQNLNSPTNTQAFLRIGTNNAPIGFSDYILCRATLSGGNVITARVPFIIRYLDTVITA